jgi:uncharacterized protein
MKKRLRKKLHKGEFKETGFEVQGEILSQDFSELEIDIFWDEFIELIEFNNLLFGGGYCYDKTSTIITFSGFLTPEKNNSLMDASAKASVEFWLRSRAEVKSFTLSPDIDAWYPKKNRENE